MSASPPPPSPRSARAAASSAASKSARASARGPSLAAVCLSAALWAVLLLCVAFIVWVAVVLFAGVAYGGSVSAVGSAPVAASPADDRAFAYVQLENGLEALLISDPDATTAAAALNVQAGSWHDPVAWPGLAHAVEHCLFLGTLKYPGEAEYGGCRAAAAAAAAPRLQRAAQPAAARRPRAAHRRTHPPPFLQAPFSRPTAARPTRTRRPRTPTFTFRWRRRRCPARWTASPSSSSRQRLTRRR